ncbi:leucine-rich repeat and coiled-coil domain-containing protein 1 isoform X1 [Cynoglossus semilaevis]|uniref:Leucine-rich repeat and coiled-coil domain-containing protein 1 n=1 Tax=Cynoglossus semilaevis TaxID=244447 RepID=A0A3P8W6P7_CYNSE|nr:leucine-rich repeat and coiled-coil domain-containing protein 1 isoform X1 [Cynoglossus semilaevis]
MGDGELSLIDKNIKSLLDIPLSPTVTSVNLHCNHIPRIEGLTSAWHLRHLDLSSNYISKIEGLVSLTSLRTLNLSCNLITKVEGLNGLVNLTRLNLSYNQINNLTGFLYLNDTKYKLKHLSLHSNNLDCIDHLLQCLLGLQSLREVTFSQDGSDNPVCRLKGYRDIVIQSLPQISVLDGLDRLGNLSHHGLSSPCDIPGLENYVDLLLSSDTSHSEIPRNEGHIITPQIDRVLNHFHQRICNVTSPPVQKSHQEFHTLNENPNNEQRLRKLEHQVSQLIEQVPTSDKSTPSSKPLVTSRKVKRVTGRTSESECESGKENKNSRIPRRRTNVTTRVTGKEIRNKPDSPDRTGTTRSEPLRSTKVLDNVGKKSAEEVETYRAIVEERDQERERRWKAEQAVRKLTEELKCLQTKVCEEKDIQSMAMHTTDRLKEVLLKERSGHCELQSRLEQLEGRCRCLTQQLDKARGSEEQHKTALKRLEESISHGEALQVCQQAEEKKHYQELENKAAALKRELDIQRVSVRQHKDKVQQLQELLATREQEHRKQLDLRMQPDGVDFREAVAKEVALFKERHTRREVELQEKLAEGRNQYTALEDEFRMALTIEASRFSEVKGAYDQVNVELMALKGTLVQSQQMEKKSGCLVQELTVVVKEQKKRISELVRSKRDTVTDLKSRLRSLEEELEKDRRLGVQLEMLRKDKARLFSQLTAQESVIDGLRAERRLWGQELAQQGASLAQDRGRLEARIEVLSTELETQKKQNESENASLKIKAKIIDDQTETIQKLKQTLLERDDRIRRLTEETAQVQKRLQQQQEELTEQQEHLSLRKEELKQHLEDKEAELEEVKRVYRDSNTKWQEKTDLLTQLESQVKRMKENFDSKERLLLEEKDKATEAHKAAVERLRCVDDAFRRQLESVQAAHQAELFRLANVKQKEIEQANEKVFEVEEEMRQLLNETETNKRIMEEKMKRLTSVLKDF